jgi:uncharacterized protein YfaA (DUF2138 family)
MILVFLSLVVWAISQTTQVFKGSINQLELDLKHPDALIVSSSLSSLPRDVQQIPLLKNVLTEDFVFYYEQHEDVLSLKGTLKRLAFEHQLQLQDKVLKASLDVPAQIAFWNDNKGAPRHAIVLLKRTVLARLIEQLVKVPATDMQLSVLSTIQINGDPVNIYALRSSGRQTLAIAAHADSVVIATDAGMLVDAAKIADKNSIELLTQLLTTEVEKNSVWTSQFNHDSQLPNNVVHSIDIGSRLLGQNYHEYFSDFKALQFNLMSKGKFQLAALINEQAYDQASFNSLALWKSIPQGLSMCVTLPVNWQKLNQLLPQDKAVNASASLALEGPAAVCWSEKGRLMAPLFVAKLTSPAAQSTSSAADLTSLYSWAIRPSDNKEVQSAQATPLDQSINGAPEKSTNSPTQIQKQANNSFLIHQAPISLSREHADDELSFTPSLLKAGDTLAFSFDPQLTQKVAQVYQKKYPSMYDAQSGLNDASLLWISPLGVSNLFLKESKPYVAGQDNNNDLPSRIVAFGKNANAWVQLEKSTLAETANSKSSDGEGKKWRWHDLSIHNPR